MAFGLLAKWFGKAKLPDELGYEAARAALETQARSIRMELAGRTDAPPETLYYLAGDVDPEIRATVAGNLATPIKADELLVDDTSDDVRFELARKIARLLPDMPQDEQSRLRQRIIHLLEKLGADSLPRVRRIVAEAVKARDDIPKALIDRLARDAQIEVSAPILQYSPLLSDEDLLELIATVHFDGALEAVAKRENLGADASDAIVATLDISAVASLLANSSATIREESIEKIMARAASVDAWHAPLVIRTELSVRAMRRIATFVTRSLVDRLASHHNLPTNFADELKSAAEARLDTAPTIDEDSAVAAINKAFARGELVDEVVIEAATLRQRPAVIRALALASGVRMADVTHILSAGSGRGITALCWKAGFSMRTALAVETHIANLTKDALVLPRAGTDYPMDEGEMRWQLQYFGVE
ncbi:MAG: DUF2336 domain-containing protein [Parvibaculum sp.]